MAEKVDNVTKVNIDASPTPEDNVVKVNLDQPVTNETEETTADTAGVVGSDENTDAPQEQKEVQPQGEIQEEELPVLEEVTEEEVQVVEDKIEEVVAEAEATGKALPENIQKLVDFIEDTGGDLNDYVKLNRDLSNLDDSEVLDEYYRKTKPHLSASERSFLLEEKFGFDEDVDEERTIKSKKIALKEQVAEARSYLDKQKTKYYEEIKAGSKLTPEQQKAMDFFNRYNKESEQNKKLADSTKKVFLQKTNNVFNESFKGFDYNIGDKKYRFNVKNVEDVKQTQSDINNFVQKFLDKDNNMSDARGYHKSLFTAMNADAIAKHFYEQGKADAIKESVAKAKNVDTNPRGTFNEVSANGIKVRVLGDDSGSLKFKMRKRK